MKTICFIDDSEYEHNLVKNEIAPCTSEFTFIQAFTFNDARRMMGKTSPACFLLDLWGKDEDIKESYLSPKEEVVGKIRSFPTLDSVYTGLENFEGDKTNEYLKRFFAIVEGWRSLFEDVCHRIGQNNKYGLSNLREVRRHYPGVPAVFYTRKALMNDAVAMFKAGADGLFIKPTGATDAETRRLTRNYGPQLIDELKKVMNIRNQ
jgi:DNA-binding NarL/FixJ family response regulator